MHIGSIDAKHVNSIRISVAEIQRNPCRSNSKGNGEGDENGSFHMQEPSFE